MTSARPFRAFVSYSHADSAFAARLQRKLEAYRLPRRLADKVEPLPGQSPGRIGPVFRDRADLSAARDLSAAVRDGIAASSALVVVASPDAAKSQWVAREIDLFRELHPDAPILVALARGESAEAVPEALRAGGLHPLAADFREGGDGKRLAFLKIVAGLADLPLDALVQRDAQRQVRRVMGVTFGAALLVVIMAMLLVMALRAREEAERQRAGAEGVIEAMLTGVRKEVRRTGNLKLRAAINQLALDYYSRQGDLADLPDESVERRARVLHALGEDDATLGNYEAGRTRFEEAHQATGRILARKPANADALFAHGQSEFWLGSVAFSSSDQARARKHWQAYFDLARALSRVEGRTPRSLLELGYAHGNLCEVNVRRELDVSAGLEHCRKALAFERGALALKPGDEEILRALANRMGWIADTLMTQERYAEARAHRESEAAVMASLLKANAKDAELRDRAVWPQIGLAKIDIAEGKIAQGLARYRECLQGLDRLGSEFPDNRTILTRRVRVNVLIGKALKTQQRSEWRRYRDVAAALLENAGGKSEPSLARAYRMLETLDIGGTK